MSSYSTNSVTVEATPTNQELIAALLSSELGAASTWWSSQQLQQLRHTVTTSNDVAKLAAVLTAAPLRLAPLEAASPAMREALTVGGTLPTQLRNEVDAGLALVQQHTLRAERLGVATLARRALERRGFSVRRDDNGDVTAIEARRGHSVLLVAVHPGGQMEMDWAGHGGDECEIEMNEVREAFAAEGLHIAVRRQQRHGNPTGGSLIARSAIAGEGDLVAGLLAQHVVVDAAPSTTTRPPARVRPSQRT